MYNQSVLCFRTNIGVMQFVGYVRHEQDLRQFNKVKESGCPYLHAEYLTEFSDAEKDRLRNHWSSVAQAGDRHGRDFSFKQTHKTGDDTSL